MTTMNRRLDWWARYYHDRLGLAVCRLTPGEKVPTYIGWNTRTADPDTFTPDHNLGILTGALSGDLVCVDLDDRGCLADADQYLPSTGMEDGRPGKPRSHRYYRVTGVPEGCGPNGEKTRHLGGPGTRPFNGPNGRLIDFLGTGNQVAAPPSWWTGGSRRELRVWEGAGRPGAPRTIDYCELFAAVERLAAAHGYQPKERRARQASAPAEPAPLPDAAVPHGRLYRDALAYLRKMGPAVSGDHGHAKALRAAIALVRGFAFGLDDAYALLCRWNRTCRPPWSERDLWHKLDSADGFDGPRGYLRFRCQLDGEPLYVGEDCHGHGRACISAPPGHFYRLAPDGRLDPYLASLVWQGKSVVLAPPSTVATNRGLVLAEAGLARAMQARGADVRTLRLPHREGRKQSLREFEADPAPFVVPVPADPAEEADRASRRAKDVQAYRRSLPRAKASPALAQATTWCERNGVRELTKDIVRQAGEEGIRRTTLRRAVTALTTQKPPSSPLPGMSPLFGLAEVAA